MSRNKHRGAEEFLDGLKNAEKYAQQFEIEKRNRDAWDSLEHRQQIAAWNAEKARKSPASRAIASTTTCQLPQCDRSVITLAGESLGICYIHGMAVATYFDIVSEDMEQKHARIDRIEKAGLKAAREDRQAESRRMSPGWIYYVIIDGHIKIGYTKDVKRRLTAYPFNSPLLAMHPGTLQLETEMHSKFAGSRAAGREYFLDTPELRNHIKEVIERFGEPDRARYERRGQRQNKRLKAS